MALSSVRVKLISPLLAATLVTFGMAPCAAMDMGGGMAAMSDHACCEAETCPDALDQPSQPAPAPADCCALTAPVNPQAPVQRTAGVSAAPMLSIDSVHPVIGAVIVPDVPAAAGPPSRSGVARHLLLSVLLI